MHKYLDSDESGTRAKCVTNDIATTFQPLADFLRQNNRIAILTETGCGADGRELHALTVPAKRLYQAFLLMQYVFSILAVRE